MTEPAPLLQRVGLHYLRRSSTRQEDSLTSQLAWSLRQSNALGIESRASLEVLDRAVTRGAHHEGDIYWDDATGTDLERPGLRAFLERVERDASVTDVFCWSRDRLSRSEKSFSAIENEDLILSSGKTLHLYGEPPVTPPEFVESRFQDDIKRFIDYQQASEYIFKLAQSSTRGLSDNAARGFWNGGPHPYGFVRASHRLGDCNARLLRKGEIVRGGGVHTVVIPGKDSESQAKLRVVRLIHDLYFEGFGGIKAIANHLNAQGIPSPNAGETRNGVPVSGKWTASNVRSILEQVAYIGKYAWGRRKVGSKFRSDRNSRDGFRKTLVSERDRNGRTRKHVVRDVEEWGLVDPAFPYEPVVPPEVFFANLKRLAERGELGGQRGVRRRRDVTKYPLDVICGGCFMPMSGCPYDRKLVFKCSTYLNSGSTACDHNWVEVDVLVPFALEAIKRVVAQDENRGRLRQLVNDQFAERSQEATDESRALRACRAELDKLVESKKRVRRDIWGDDEDLAAEAKNRLRDLLAEIREAEQEIASLERQNRPAPETSVEEDVEATLALLDDLHLLLDRVPKDHLWDLFQALGVSVLVEFERVKVGRRNNIPVRATVHLGGEEAPKRTAIRRDPNPGLSATRADPEPGQPTLCGKDGRGERI